jgi:hypothetical protein
VPVARERVAVSGVAVSHDAPGSPVGRRYVLQMPGSLEGFTRPPAPQEGRHHARRARCSRLRLKNESGVARLEPVGSGASRLR